MERFESWRIWTTSVIPSAASARRPAACPVFAPRTSRRCACCLSGLRAAVAGLNDSQLDTPYREGGWTVRQVVHHVADSHANAYIRFKLALTEDWPTIKPYDEAAWAKLADSRLLPVDVSLALIEALHARWVALLESMTDEDFRKGFNHPERAGRTWPRPWRCTTGTRATTPRTSPACARGRAGRPAEMASGEAAPTAGRLAQSIEEYLAEHPAAAVLEDGRVLSTCAPPTTR